MDSYGTVLSTDAFLFGIHHNPIDSVLPEPRHIHAGHRVHVVAGLPSPPLALEIVAPIQLGIDSLLGDLRILGLGHVLHGIPAFRRCRVSRPLHESHPEQVEPLLPDDGDYVVPLDFQVHWLPWRPFRAVVAPVEVLVRKILGAGYHVEPALVGVARGFLVHRHDFQARDLLQALQVLEDRVLHEFLGNLPLQQRRFQLLEQVRLVVPEFRLEPILRVEEDASVGLPKAEPSPYLPLLFVDGRR